MNKKLLTFLVLSLVLIFSSCAQRENDGGKMSDHIDIDFLESDSLNISVEAPEGWATSSSSYLGTQIRHYTSLPENSKDNFTESISVTAETLSEGATLESYVNSNVEAIEITFDDFEIISPVEYRSIGEYDGANVVFSYSMGAIDVVIDQSFVVKDGTAYIITCNATPKSYDSYKDIFVKARDSFKIN